MGSESLLVHCHTAGTIQILQCTTALQGQWAVGILQYTASLKAHWEVQILLWIATLQGAMGNGNPSEHWRRIAREQPLWPLGAGIDQRLRSQAKHVSACPAHCARLVNRLIPLSHDTHPQGEHCCGTGAKVHGVQPSM